MSVWAQDFKCPTCEVKFELFIDKKDRYKPVPCQTAGCTSLAGPTVMAPMPLRASHPDGTRRGGMRQLAEAAQIESDSFNLPVEKRGEHKKAIKELTKAKP